MRTSTKFQKELSAQLVALTLLSAMVFAAESLVECTEASRANTVKLPTDSIQVAAKIHR